ncbi:MAG: hypothetical protein JW944_04180 [Deltaproteobacteria bacterium]|nr:hypothetical protein [Deltaproteobacteria bacterium]
MSEEEITRRGAMGRILTLVAMSAGISVNELTRILSAEAATVTSKSKSIATIKDSASSRLKMLKVKLSGFDKAVFQNEFGRITELQKISQMKIPGIDQSMQGMGCIVHFMGGVSGANEASTCPNFETCIANGSSSCPNLEDCRENVCTGQDFGGSCPSQSCPSYCGINDCNGQGCSILWDCGENECTDQDCNKLNSCDKNNTNIAGLIDLLSRFKNDQYVQNLMSYFKVTDTRQLANQVNSMISQKRAITPSQLQSGQLQR